MHKGQIYSMASARIKMTLYLEHEELKGISLTAAYVLEPGELLPRFPPLCKQKRPHC